MNNKLLFVLASLALLSFFVFGNLVITGQVTCDTDVGLCGNESECSGVGGYWCESSVYNDEEEIFVNHSYCSNSPCSSPVGDDCSSDYLSVCNSMAECEGVGGDWCENLNFNQTGYFVEGSCVTQCLSECNLEVVNGCVRKEDCESAGGFWNEFMDIVYVNGEDVGDGLRAACDISSFECNRTFISSCRTQTSCEDVGGFWYNNITIEDGEESVYSFCTSCGADWLESPFKYHFCNDKKMCNDLAEGEWCEYEVLVSSSDNPLNIFVNDLCFDPAEGCPKCTLETAWNCVRENDCSSAGANWCEEIYGEDDGSIHTRYGCERSDCRNCEEGNPWNCGDSFSCDDAGGEWCSEEDENRESGYREFCSDKCPVCTIETPWNCNSEAECTNGGAKWCENTYFEDDTGTLESSFSCDSECNTCDSNHPEYCPDERFCVDAGLKWCDTEWGADCVPADFECPVCSIETPWHCREESSCSNVGASWCERRFLGKDQDEISYYHCASECLSCSLENPSLCIYEDECASVGSNWCTSKTTFVDGTINANSFCSSDACSSCNVDTPFKCETELECNNIGGSWVKANVDSEFSFLTCKIE